MGSWRGPRAGTVFGVVLLALLVACSTPEPPTPPPLPPVPPAARALVAWSDTACANVKSVDELRTSIDPMNKSIAERSDEAFVGSDADSYLRQITISVDGVIKSLKESKPAGLAAPDAFFADLVKALEGIRPQLPPVNDMSLTSAPVDQKVTKARHVAGVVATIEPQVPKLAALAGKTLELTGSYNLASRCEPVRPAGQVDPAQPSRALVGWADAMCPVASSLPELGRNPLDDPIVRDSRFAQLIGPALEMRISGADSRLTSLISPLMALEPTGVKEADDYRVAIIQSAQAALSKLPKADSSAGMSSIPDAELKRLAAEVSGVLATVKPQGDLQAIVQRDPKLLAAYNLAPGCEPIKPPGTPAFPVAANGTDVGACKSGACQVQVTDKVDFVVNGLRFTAQVSAGEVTVTNDISLIHLGSGGEGSFGSGGKNVEIVVAGVKDNTAVLDISSS
ncbi:hypothetical protein [Amycolatopsis sp. cmx-4-68]|uniref:hypothetical protein n=1 Tax=Amycolatopsis sp. cmx-4-68 TaxID=2790938 RepID=UPI00397E80B3